MNLPQQENPFETIDESVPQADTGAITSEAYDPQVIRSILENSSSIDDTLAEKTHELLQETMHTGVFIERTKKELEDMFYGFTETVVKSYHQPWYERLAFWKDPAVEIEIKQPGLHDKILGLLCSMQKSLLHVKQQLYANGRTVRNMITYAINLEEDALVAQSQVHQAALYAQHLLERKKSIAAYVRTEEFNKELPPEKRSAILLAEDRAEEELDLLRTSVSTLEFKSALYRQNAQETKQIARVMRMRFSRFYEVIAQAVNQVNQLHMAAQSGTFLALDTNIQELVGHMQEAHTLLDEHGSFMYSLQSHLAQLSDNALDIPHSHLPRSTQQRLGRMVDQHSNNYDWISRALTR